MRCYIVLLCLWLGLVSSVSHAQSLFSENFEGDMSQWTGQNGSGHNGQIVTDPLQSDNKVLNFNQITNSGDLFSINGTSLVPGQNYLFSLDYLGLEVTGVSNPDDFGGFVGLVNGLYAGPSTNYRWVFGTQAGGVDSHLIDNNNWSHYEFSFAWDSSLLANGNSSNVVHIMLEDFNYSGGTAGDAYFDNLQITAVPEPSIFTLLGIGAINLLIYACQRNRRLFSKSHTRSHCEHGS
jgi:chitinase